MVDRADADGPSDKKADRVLELMDRIQRTDNLYEILGVRRDADDAAVKKAYRKAALLLHPDKCQLDGAKEAFQKVSSAFACLSDAEHRSFYDRTGHVRDSSSAIGHSQHDPEEIFRAFFGENFEAFANDGRGGVHFHSFQGGGVHSQMFTFNMGGSGFGSFRPPQQAAAEGVGGAGGAQGPHLPWPLPMLLHLVPSQVLLGLLVLTFFWSIFWFLRHLVYFLPVFWFAPTRLKVPLCLLLWVLIVLGYVGGGSRADTDV
jgi:hypothetical protein